MLGQFYSRNFAAVFILCFLTSTASAKPKTVRPLKEWSGSIADASLAKDAPEFLVDVGALQELWKKWKLDGEPPEIDFDEALIVITTTRGSRLRLFVSLNNKGDLRVGGLATRDLRPGFRYVIAAVPREGVKTVNGKKLDGNG